jgi:hypothetical protein
MLTSMQSAPFRKLNLLLKCSCFAVAGAAALGMAQPAAALTILDEGAKTFTFFLNQSRFDGGPGSVNDPSLTKHEPGDYWLKAVFQQMGQGEVKLSLMANLDPNSGAFISSAAFNLANDIGISSVTCLSGSACVNPASKLDYNDVNMANNIRGLDLEFLLPTSNAPGTNRLDGKDTVAFTILGDDLTFQSFLALNQPSQGGVEGIYAAARLQGYGEGSSIVYKEVPGPLPVLGAVAAFQASRRLRRRLATGEASAQPKG